MSTTFPTRDRLDERLRIAVTAEEKHKLFEVAAQRGTTVSDLIRRAARQAAGLDQQAA